MALMSIELSSEDTCVTEVFGGVGLCLERYSYGMESRQRRRVLHARSCSDTACKVMVYIVLAYICMANVRMAQAALANTVLAYTGMACIVIVFLF